MLEAGTKAPDFSLPDQDGKMHSLSQYQGSSLLVYFYPEDDTPGCTKEACLIRDSFPDFSKLNVVVLGISADSIASHKQFAQKYHLPFTLLSDTDKHVIKTYQAWGKKMLGNEGILRSSYLINPEGTIVKAYPRVNPLTHAAHVLADLQATQKQK